MSDHHHHRPVPRAALFGAAALIAFALIAISFGQNSGIGLTSAPEAEAAQTQDLVFADRNDGAVVVYEADDGMEIAVLEPGTNGFVRGVMRSLARERRQQGVDSTVPVRLTLWDDGRLSLEDPATGFRSDLDAFGPTNAGAFASFLDADVTVN